MRGKGTYVLERLSIVERIRNDVLKEAGPALRKKDLERVPMQKGEMHNEV